MRKKSKSFCQVDHLELRRLLSTVFVSSAATGGNNDGTSWANAFTTLQAALVNAASGTTIEVGQGTYTPGSSQTATFQLVDGVNIEGGFAGTGQSNPDTRDLATFQTILSGDIGSGNHSYHVVTGDGTDSTAVLDGFTITDGNAAGSSDHVGGGIHDKNGSPTISDSIITGNTAAFGGGGIYSAHSTSTLNNCTISGNTAGTSGGGMYDRYSTLSLTSTTITGNSSASNGAGILNNHDTSDTLFDCIITGNSATIDGGGIENRYTSQTLTNCVIAGNFADQNGGGMNNHDSTSTLINCTLSGNAAIQNGGGIYFDGTGAPTLTNSIIWNDFAQAHGNEIFGNSSGTAAITFSDVEGGATGTGNINADPQFVRAVGVQGGSDFGDLRLTSASPAIDAGSNAAVTGINTDLDGDARINGSTVDMGAYELSIVYVDVNATGSDVGTSWANAFTNLQDALDSSGPGTTINVAQGTYFPTTGTDSTATFQLKSGVSIYGGFAGNTTSNPAERDVSQFVTVLSGDIGTHGDSSDNSYNVVTGSGVNSSAVLDGFTISDGNARSSHGLGGGVYNNDGSPSINDCVITGNNAIAGGGINDIHHSSPAITDSTISGNTAIDGAGIANYDQSSPTLIDCFISGNTAINSGGGIYGGSNSSPALINCLITTNVADTGSGGALYNNSASATLLNCTITQNTADSGGAISDVNTSSVLVTNSILWNDSTGEVANDGSSSVTLSHSDIEQSGFAGTNGNIDADPKFINTTVGQSDFRLQVTSPAVDAGLNSAISGTNTDLNQGPRIINGTVDMGAYEAEPIIFVDASATGTNDGTSWANAFTTLTAALAHAVADSGQSIDVAQGTYTPTTGTDRTATFQLVDGVDIEGGFAGNTTSNPGSRNVLLFTTVLSGDIGTAHSNSDNSYHVVNASNTDATAVLEGFTITDGNASGTNTLGYGGGIYANSGGADINDCTISGNSAVSGGGVSAIYSSLQMTNCVISGNTATDIGGGIYSYSSTPVFTNCTISGNTAADGGGVADTGSVDNSLTLINSILWGDTATTNNEIYSNTVGTLSITHSDVEGGFTGTGNINVDPMFVRAVGTNGVTDFGDLNLLNTSPAINAGLNSAVPTGITTDLAGNNRIIGGTVDMGAFEATLSHLVFGTQPTGNTAAGGTLPVVVDIKDADGNIVTTDDSTVTIQIASGPNGASLNGTLTAIAHNGVATFTGLNITLVGSYMVSVSDGTLAVATSNSFNIIAGAPASLTITQQPTTTTTAGQDIPLTVEVKDQFGNLADGSNVTVAIAPGSSTGTLNGTTTLATTGGIANFSGLNIDQSGSYSFTITDGSLSSLTSGSFNITPGAAAQLVISQQPGDTAAGQDIPLTIQVKDSFGNLVDGTSVNVAIAPGGSTGTLNGTTTLATTGGVANFSDLTIDQIGSFSFTITDGSLSNITSNTFNITPGAAASLSISQQPTAATAGQDIPLTVQVKDSFGNLVDGSSVTVAITSGSSTGTLNGTTTLATTGGTANFSDLTIDQIGTYSFTITDGSAPAVTSSDFVINPGSAAKLVFIIPPSDTVAGQTMTGFAVEVEDQFGNLAVNDTSTVSLSSTPAGITASVAANHGIAEFTNVSSTIAGTYSLSATDGSLTPVNSTTFNVTPAAPAQLVILQQPASALAGQNIPVSIEVEDQFGNLMDGSSVTLAIATGPSDSTLGGTLTVPTTGGIATFNNLTLDRAGAFTLSATDGSLPAVTSSSFNITYAGNQLVFTSEPGSAIAGAKLGAIKVSPENTTGNPLTTNKSKIKLTLSSGGKLLGSSTVAVKNGVAIFSKLLIQKAGTYTLTATDPTFGSMTSHTFTITAGAASKMLFNPQPAAATHGTPFNVDVELTDKFGNIATTNASTVSLLLGSHPKTAAPLSLTQAVTGGTADFDNVVLDTAGSYTLKAADGKLKATSKKFLVS